MDRTLLKKGQEIEVQIDKIVFGGEGLGRYKDIAIFVPMSVPGDRVRVELISVKKTYARGLITEVVEAGADRVEGGRLTFEDFHGCDFAMLNYESQLKYKKLMVDEVLKGVGRLEGYEIADTIGADNPTNYRNKIIEPFAFKGGRIVSGFFKRKSHEVFEVEENLLQSPLANKIVRELKDILNKKRISVYNEKSHRGVLRHVMVRTTSYNEAMVVLIVRGEVDKKVKQALYELRDRCSEIKSAYISINNRRTNVALGDKNILIYGKETIKERLFDIDFNISPTSFFQINLEQTEKLYSKAISYFDDVDNKHIVDAYSGAGTIAMIMSKAAKKVYAIELVESATRDAIATSRENKIDNIEFINGRAEEKLIELIDGGHKIDSIIFDPPRKGIAENILHKVNETSIDEIVYISCNPSTFARDAGILDQLGYKLTKVQPVDMFPQTSHIEVIGKFIKEA
ncbi:putative RNA methyltransferase [Propionigenium maris DSM 9537]|uniref:RNA methyltransferase n=1 Tax=Propionigenium maris DSM 9537 TaxID=1123000 RepID=A0A9W6GIL7_9FUSO|nr:23S rRNA (uracil(1939)-C(5))-methyltransferase RlmD [Propionigenium maris]GLI55869.1 putative RNA methyltransferase [Propionigenium maris DSM 9537]